MVKNQQEPTACCYCKRLVEKREMQSATEILAERQSTHGDFASCAEISQDIKLIIATNDRNLSHRQREALEMIAVKMARILNGGQDHTDSWQDIAGYAHLGGGLFE